jgi:hypothetical protein
MSQEHAISMVQLVTPCSRDAGYPVFINNWTNERERYKKKRFDSQRLQPQDPLVGVDGEVFQPMNARLWAA